MCHPQRLNGKPDPAATIHVPVHEQPELLT